MIPEKKVRNQWTSQLTFILAVTGSAIGLGNIWKFPYVAGEHGGGVFILIYILAVLLILPVMTGEIMLGRRGRRSPVNSLARLAVDFNRSPKWKLLGWLAIAGGFLILSYYSVIAGWTMAYLFRAGAGIFNNATVEGVRSIYESLVGDPEKMLAWHTLFMMVTAGIVAYGIKGGIERMVSYCMPMLFVLLLLLLLYVVVDGAFMESLRFMFVFDFSKVSIETCLVALGQAFFSLSLGLGAVMVYGSYLPAHVRIVRTASIVAAVDTLVAIVAGLVVFALVFEYGMQPAQGPGLVFKTLPLIFGRMPAGEFFGAAFFLLLMLAAWTSGISLIEPSVAWMCEAFNCSRGFAAWVVGFIAWVLGIGTIFSFSDTAQWSIYSVSLFNVLDYATANVMLPLGGVLIAVFAGWKLPAVVLREELNIVHPGFYRLWRLMLRYLSPGIILLILVYQVWDSL